MTRSSRSAACRLTITIRDAADDDGQEAAAECSCTWPNRHGGHGWHWLGWAANPVQAAEAAGHGWVAHREDVASLRRGAGWPAR